jgi:4-alpha-glucanotransferase
MSPVPKSCLDRRRAGVLLHVTSLPGEGQNGDLGAEAYHFVDFLASCGFTVWQTLPVVPVGPDGSPYQSSSAHAGDPRLISIAALAEEGWLDPRDVRCLVTEEEARCDALRWAYQGFNRFADEQDRVAQRDFRQANAYWLDDYVLFQALREELSRPWWEWPAPVLRRRPQALVEARARLSVRLDELRFEQFVFFRQWRRLHEYARSRGIRLFGDIPIFVAHDSAEVWAHPEYFELDEQGHTTVVAGVPPDYFSALGQRWGNPLYRWDVMHTDGFAFWVDRMRTQLRLFDLVRIDHFRGFEACWEIPASEPNAINGRWVPGPGDALFDRLRDEFGELPLVAEDLGVITDEVRGLRDRQAMPGMKILQFAFSGGADNPYLLFNHPENSVVYTGTHDNDTTLSWYQGLSDGERAAVDEYLGRSREAMPWPLIQWALLSVARLAVVPMQDLLGLGASHRMNLPGSSTGNWRWRFDWDQVPNDLAERLRRRVGMCGRVP